MKLGIMLGYGLVGSDPIALRDLAQGLEGVGIDFVSIPEHVVGTHPDRVPGQVIHTFDKPYYEPIATLGFIAGATTKLELATSIMILPQRQTVLVAKQIAMLDLLCAGRLRLGIGVGRNAVEYQALNEDFTNRGARMEEQIDVLRRLWTEELVTFNGNWHTLDEVGINPRPTRSIPIWMGSFFKGTTNRVLERIGRVGDGWFPQSGPNEELLRALGFIHDTARSAGRDPASIGIECVTDVEFDGSPAQWSSTAQQFGALGATHLKAMLKPERHSANNVDAIVSLARSWRQALQT
jgi:probable F420-dependent oxidoreductase